MVAAVLALQAAAAAVAVAAAMAKLNLASVRKKRLKIETLHP